jgi:predicted phosphodiesterase
MSLIAIISDIHGNIDALEAVLEDIDQHNTDIVACLGARSWRDWSRMNAISVTGDSLGLSFGFFLIKTASHKG